jgi:mannose-1-phosphate guanylyltransferase
LTLTGDRTLLQLALERIEAQVPAERTWVITGAAYCEETRKQLPHLPPQRVLGEPCGRDTAACVALGAALIARQDPDGVVVVTPADHLIEPVQEFRRAVHVGEQLAHEYPNVLITFGVIPTYPATGYGYIHRGPELTQRQGLSVFRVQAFREKPKSEIAEQFVALGQYFWNSGIFIWKVGAILAEMARQQPGLYAAAQRIADAWPTSAGEQVLQGEYPQLKKLSIDYAVMEHAREVLAVQAPFRWDDVGSWLALERQHPQDADGNTVLAFHAGLKTHNCVLVAEEGHLIATIGVQNLLIVHDGNATLVADRAQEGAVKEMVELLQKKGFDQYL